MKRIAAAVLACAFALAGCASASTVRDVMDLSEEQANTIERILADAGIEVKSIKEAEVENPESETATAWLEIFTPYNITSAEGNKYRLTLLNESKEVQAVVDMATQEFVYGDIF